MAPGRGRGRGRGAAAPRGGTRRPASGAGDVEPGPSAPPTTSNVPTPILTPTSRPAAPAKSSGPKFRPKSFRRTEAERKQLAAEETKKQAEHAAEESRQLRRGTRARGRGRGRGRGDTMRSDRRIIKGGLRSGSGTSSNLYPKSETTKDEGGDDEPATPEIRVNADRLHKVADEPDDINVGIRNMRLAPSSQTSGIMPVGLLRERHKKNEVVVATSKEMDNDEESDEDEGDIITAGDLAKSKQILANDNKVWGTAPKGKGPTVKTEDGGERPMNINDVPLHTGGGGLSRAMTVDSGGTSPEHGGVDTPSKTRKKKDIDLEEQMRAQDAAFAIAELVNGDSLDTDGDPPRESGLYLFQIPPLMPMLFKSDKSVFSNPVKKEPPDDLEILETPPVPQEIDLTNDDYTPGQPLTKEAGFIGKLNIRKSGKIELDWGGQLMEITPGTANDFYSTAVLVQMDDVKPKGQEEAGKAAGLGAIRGKFVATPVWGEEGEWNTPLDPEDFESNII